MGDGDKEDQWKAALEQSLVRSGHQSLDAVRVIAPKYAHALVGFDEHEELPARTIKTLGRDAAKLNRREFERRLAGVEHRIGKQDEEHIINEALGEAGRPALEAAADAAVATPFFKQAANYLGKKQIRAQVLNRILTKLPKSGKIVIVAHSLGSVIAADLLLRLPTDIQVSAIVTIGSPLANGKFKFNDLRTVLTDPPSNLAWWVNFRNAWDPVATRRGLSSEFPWLLDHKINTGFDPNLKRPHTATKYLGHDTVANTIGYAVFGSKSKEVSLIAPVSDIPLDEAESRALLGVRYGHLIKNQLTAETRRRYLAALRAVQAQTVSDIRARNNYLKRPIPSQISRLDFDFSDPMSLLPEPSFKHSGTTKEAAVDLLTALAVTNVISPFEIAVPDDAEQRAMEELAAEMGLMKKFGRDVLDSGKQAQGVLRDNQNLRWVKVGAVLAGVAALVVGTGGLALAAAPGLAGAAIVTSALASFGPGGMIGGLITAGALVGGGGLLVGSGGGTIAAGLSGAETTAEVFEGVVSLQLAAVILRQGQGVESDPAVWHFLVGVETRVNRQHERLDEISDPKATAVRELAKKLTVVKRALQYMMENGLEPGAPVEADDGNEPSEKHGARFISQFPRGK